VFWGGSDRFFVNQLGGKRIRPHVGEVFDLEREERGANVHGSLWPERHGTPRRKTASQEDPGGGAGEGLQVGFREGRWVAAGKKVGRQECASTCQRKDHAPGRAGAAGRKGVK